MKMVKLLLMSSLMFALTQVNAKDLGVIGQTYAITEQDAVEQIIGKLTAMEKTGELEKLKEKAIKKSLHSVKNPKPNNNIKTATKRSNTLYNPTKVYEEALKDDEGRIIIAAGKKINPLDYITLSKKFIFFDGRDKEQVAAVKRIVNKEGEKVKAVLIAGSWFDISKSWGRQVYFDQGGYLAAQFNLTQVPAIVSQSNKTIRIDVIPAKDLGK